MSLKLLYQRTCKHLTTLQKPLTHLVRFASIIKVENIPIKKASMVEVRLFFRHCRIMDRENGDKEIRLMYEEFPDMDIIHGIKLEKNETRTTSCYIELQSEKELQKALNLNGKLLNNYQYPKRLKISRSTSEEMNKIPITPMFVKVCGVHPYQEWNVTETEVKDFFTQRGCSVAGDENGVHFIYNRHGMPTNICIVKLSSRDDHKKALERLHESVMGAHRIIILNHTLDELDKYSVGSETGHTVHMSGLPKLNNESDVRVFLHPLNPVSVKMMEGEQCFVDFATHEEAVQSLSRNQEFMGNCSIALQLWNRHKMHLVKSTTGHMVHMRGLPQMADEDDVRQFLNPLIPETVKFFNHGNCFVDFVSQSDAEVALKKQWQFIGEQQIQLKNIKDSNDDNLPTDASFYSGTSSEVFSFRNFKKEKVINKDNSYHNANDMTRD